MSHIVMSLKPVWSSLFFSRNARKAWTPSWSASNAPKSIFHFSLLFSHPSTVPRTSSASSRSRGLGKIFKKFFIIFWNFFRTSMKKFSEKKLYFYKISSHKSWFITSIWFLKDAVSTYFSKTSKNSRGQPTWNHINLKSDAFYVPFKNQVT